MRVLGIETSCDETAAAIVGDDRAILSQALLSQQDHAPFGGVVPEVAARAHLQHLDRLVDKALAEAGLPLAALDGIAATTGPGLIGGVMVGAMYAKGLAAAADLPFIAVNHLEGHALTARLADPQLQFPYLLLLVSGGHTQLLEVLGTGRYRRLGTTLDDALGEAFDKSAKLLGLPQPGGPALERAAGPWLDDDSADAAFQLPRPMLGRPGCDFSFSGLKAAIRRWVEARTEAPPEETVGRLAAAFHRATAAVLVDRCRRAITGFAERHGRGHALVVAGGVAANRYLRARLEALAACEGMHFAAPPLALCTDNAAMIAWAGVERLSLGLQDGLDTAPRPRWPLEEIVAAE